MDNNSPANIGKIIATPTTIEAITTGAGVFLRNNENFKIFGAGLAYSGNVPSKTNAVLYADYLSFFGINAIRIHHLDHFYPSGILSNDGTTQTLDTTALDLFDYYMAQLRSKGIYAYLCTHCYRQWTNQDIAVDVIVDNLDAACIFTGSWTSSTTTAGYYGSNYQYKSSGSGLYTATFTPTIITEGNYSIYAMWSADDNRTSNAKFIVTHASGTGILLKNQRINGGVWNSLGDYYLSVGTTNNVVLSDVADGIVIADAIKCEYIGPQDFEGALDVHNPLKTITHFDTRCIELQKDYINKVLSHINPYTGLAYKDDPMFAIIEIVNEDSFLKYYWNSGHLDPALYSNASTRYPEYYLNELTLQWNTWLENKYITPAATIAAWGLNEIAEGIQIFDHSVQGNSWGVVLPAVASKVYSSGSCIITITTASTSDWHVNYGNTGLTISTDKIYELTTVLSASSERTIQVSLQAVSPPEYQPAYNINKTITTTPTEYKTYFKSTFAGTMMARIFVGKNTGTVTLGSFILKEYNGFPIEITEKDKTTFTFHRPYYAYLTSYTTQHQADITEFMHYTERAYYNTMRDYIKNTVGCSALIQCNGGGKSYADEEDYNGYTDFYDAHSYHDHPRFPNISWDSDNFTITNTRMITHSTLGMVGSVNNVQQTIKTLPFTITEYQHCYPNNYAYEGNLMMAIYGLEYEWNGMFIFAFSHNATFSNLSSFFDIAPNPQKMLIAGLGAYIFQKATNWSFTNTDGVLRFEADQIKGIIGSIADNTYTLGNITFKAKTNGIVFIFSTSNETFALSKSLIVVTLGDVRNTGVYWIDSSHFEWGNAPVQLQRIETYFSMPYDQNITIYALDNRGTVDTKIDTTRNNGPLYFNNRSIDSPWFIINTP